MAAIFCNTYKFAKSLSRIRRDFVAVNRNLTLGVYLYILSCTPEQVINV